MHSDELEKVTLRDREWYKIRGDDAFPYVLEDWYEGYGEAYLKYVSQPLVAVQAGGFCGIYPKLLSESFSLVYTFEPDPLNFYCLTQNCQSDNIIKFQAALGKEHQLISVRRNCETNKGMNTVIPLPQSAVPTFRIDDLQLHTCNLIQLDTEGYEYNILQGAVDTIRRCEPVISVEDNKDSISNLLKSYGYTAMMTINRDTIFAK